MAEKPWRTWDEIEAEAKAAGRLDEARVAEHQERMRAEQRAYRLAEIRRSQGLTQNDVASILCVSQRRVSAVERGALERTEIGTVLAYVAALGGEVEMVARFGDEKLVIADQAGLAAGKSGVIAEMAEAAIAGLSEQVEKAPRGRRTRQAHKDRARHADKAR